MRKLSTYEKKLKLAKSFFGEDVKVYGEKHLWYVEIPKSDGIPDVYKFPEWNGWCWVIPNSLARPRGLDESRILNNEEE